MMRTMRTRLLLTTCLVAGAAAASAQADGLPDGYGGLPAYGSLPAVSAPNGKLAAFGGGGDGTLYGVSGSLTTPLGHAFGAQIDGVVGSAKDAAFYGVGGHLFWRDPAKGLLGLYGSYVTWDADNQVGVASPINGVADVTGANVGKAGVEGALYLDRVSLEGLAAYQFGTRTGFAGRATLAFYPTDDFRIDGGVRFLQGSGTVGTVGAEWQPHGGSGLTLFTSGTFGGDHASAVGGLRFYFAGDSKSLIQRHRQDDPGIDLPDDLFTAAGGSHCPADKPSYNPDGNLCY